MRRELTAQDAVGPMSRLVRIGQGIAIGFLAMGNGMAIADDCPAAGRVPVVVAFAVPEGNNPSTLTVEVAYPKDQLAIPGTRNEQGVLERVSGFPKDGVHAINDQDGTLRVVIAGTSAIDPGPIFTIDFDACEKTAFAAVEKMRCSVVGCAGKYGKITDCTCNVRRAAVP